MRKFTCLSGVVALACACAGLARADGNAPVTRSQVAAQLDTARATGELQAMHGEDSGSFWLASHASPASGLTRQQVRAETVAAQGARDWAPMHGEDSGSMHMAAAPRADHLTRAEVIAEAQQARARGEIASRVGEDSGSVQLSRQSAERRVLYVGPDVGSGSERASVSPVRVN